MKLKQEFVLRNVAGDMILVPVVGQNDSFEGIITLNETGVFIWKQIEAEKEIDEITAAMLEEYEVSEEHARRNVIDFCEKLEKLGIL